MERKYRIQILDKNDQIKFFDRIKTSYGAPRVITSLTGGKVYKDYSSAELDVSRIKQYYASDCIVEIVQEDEYTVRDNMISLRSK